MKSNLRALPVFLSVIFGAVICAPRAQSTPATKPPVVGGYNVVSTKDRDAISALRYAFKVQRRRQREVIALVVLTRTEKQIVAGTNYRLYFKMKIDGQIEQAVAVVNKDLKNKYSLSSFGITSSASLAICGNRSS